METVREHDVTRASEADEWDESLLTRSFENGWFTAARIQSLVDVVVLVVVTGFVLGQLGLGNLLMNTTAAGGDMGAHVWGPAYLRDHVLPHFRLSGWTPDWYDGFPAYQFYMVVPALAVVILNAGFHGWAAIPVLLVAAVVAVAAFRSPARSLRRRLLVTAAIVVPIVFAGMPYNVAFKVVTVLGVLSLPVAAYVLGRMADLPFPTPAIFAMATLPYLFNRQPTTGGTGNIIGGSITSMLAGEFSFSLSLVFAVLFLGTVIAGLRTGRYRALAAVFLALTALCHVIPAIFAIIAALLALVVWPGKSRLLWMACALPVGGLISAFWTFPFYARSDYVNDMGWAKLPDGSGAHSARHLIADFFSNARLPGQSIGYREDVLNHYLVPDPLKWLLVLAAVGLVVSIVLRIRTGWWLALVALAMAVAFIVTPETRLWNARLLPFYYLALFLLAAIGVSELVRAFALLIAPDPDRPLLSVNVIGTGVVLAIILVTVGLPLHALPGQQTAGATTKWGPFSTTDRNPAPDWARWNYRGYQDLQTKPAYPEYYGFVSTAAQIGHDRGCGRLMWEYNDQVLERYGTPMAPMLVSLFTDGCIGSMEGLYFESSTTTPFHFIDQRELSANCSCAQRNLPYGSMDIDQGVEHLQMLGVKYYATATPQARDLARKNGNLTEIASSAPWTFFEVKDAPLVESLTNVPAVVTDHNQGLEWVYGSSDPHTAPKKPDGTTVTANGPAMTWYTDPTKWDVYLAADGPSSWPRVADGQAPPVTPAPTAQATNVRMGTDTIDFDVDHPGTPMLVKASYFPNWSAEGADGPYRVTPNLMVVVPTANHVHLHYGTTKVEYLAWFLTLVGIALAIVLARAKPLTMPEPEPAVSFSARFLDNRDAEGEALEPVEPEPFEPVEPAERLESLDERDRPPD